MPARSLRHADRVSFRQLGPKRSLPRRVQCGEAIVWPFTFVRCMRASCASLTLSSPLSYVAQGGHAIVRIVQKSGHQVTISGDDQPW